MIRGLYGAATALDAAWHRHEVVTENLAHLNVPGYRRRDVNLETFDRALGHADGNASLMGVRASGVHVNFEPGPLVSTGNPFDVAITGDGFFTVQGPNGPLYTRCGTFRLSPEGELVTASGMPVVGGGGRIAIPQGASAVSIAADGTVQADNYPVGQLQLVRFANPSALVPAGTTLFQAPPGVQPETGGVTVQQGFREDANLNAAGEMVAMMLGMRHYESAQRALRVLGETVGLNTRPQS
ncbi:MAG TPA: flagellar hook basal-body protein [Gemmataceae bacterium]|nr:flagellar hook basal-body protein [Gemmataceae bacterium]